METFLATLLVFCLVVAVMSIGVVLSGRSLRGSCGGTGEGCECNEERQRACAAKRSEAH